MRIFAASGERSHIARYVDTYRLFKRGQPWATCQAALANPPQGQPRLAMELMKANGIDTADTVLAKGLFNRLIHSLRMQEGRGRVRREGERKGVTVRRLPQA